MGKGTIISHIEDGQYSVTINYDTSSIDAKITILGDRKTLLESELATEQAKPEPDKTKVGLLKLQIVSVEKQIEYLENISKVPADYNTTAWCADLTEDLSGEVGIIEIGREKGNGVNIQPGYDANAVYNTERDGQLIPLMAQTPAATFYNLAMLPGFQKWKPMFRYGTITEIDKETDICSVTLDLLTSSQQGLQICQGFALAGVPINYMDCDSFPFEVDDEVIVKFTDYDFDNPEVVGFKSNPKPCACWLEPFDGPLWTTLYPWQSLSTGTIIEGGGSALLAPSISIAAGVLDVEIYSTPAGGEWLEHVHTFYYWPDDPIRTNIYKIICDLTAGSDNMGMSEKGHLRVFLACSLGGVNVYFHLYRYFGAAIFYPQLDDLDDGQWHITYSGGSGTDYGRMLSLNETDYIDLPVTGATLKYIGIEFSRAWIGGAGVPPDQISGGTFSINLLTVC